MMSVKSGVLERYDGKLPAESTLDTNLIQMDEPDVRVREWRLLDTTRTGSFPLPNDGTVLDVLLDIETTGQQL
jgi:hypothetical protein